MSGEANACACSGQCGGAHDGGVCGAPDGAIVHRLRAAPWRYVLGGPFETRGQSQLMPHVRVKLSTAAVGRDAVPTRLCQHCRSRAAGKPKPPRAGQGALPIGGGR